MTITALKNLLIPTCLEYEDKLHTTKW